MIGATLAVAAIVAQASIDDARPYRALGNEPSWTLTIESGRIVFAAPGSPRLAVATPAPQNDQGIIHYDAPGLRLSIIPVPCDPVRGRRYAHSVFVTVGSEEFSGCGGDELAADSLDGTSWYFVEVAGETIPLTGDALRDDHYAISFGVDRFVGYGGCNRIGGRYERAGTTLTIIPPLMSTRRACAEPIMRREQRLVQLLGAPLQVSLPDSDTLLLTGEGATIRLRRMPEHSD